MHSRTSSPSSYVKDFQELVKVYTSKRTLKGSSHCTSNVTEDFENGLEHSSNTSTDSSDDELDDQDKELSSLKQHGFSASKERQLSVEFLEDDFDEIQTADDFDGMSVLLIIHVFI